MMLMKVRMKCMNDKPMKDSRREKGISLIEGLVTLVIIGIGLIGAMNLQVRSMSMQTDSLNQRSATALAAEFIERVISNRDVYRSQLSGTSSPADLVAWEQEVSRRLPGSAVDLQPVTGSDPLLMSVTIAWQEAKAGEQSLDGNCATFATETGIPEDPSYRCLSFSFFPG